MKLIYSFFLLANALKVCSSVSILFACNKKIDLPPEISKCFQYPPGVDPEKTEKSFYSPLRSKDFFNFLATISQLKASVVPLNEKRISKLYEAVTATDAKFHDFIKSNGGASLSNLDSSLSNEIQMDKLAHYADFWNKYSYVYPYCDLSQITVEPDYFAEGGSSICYKASFPSNSNHSSCSIEFLQDFVLKKLTKFS